MFFEFRLRCNDHYPIQSIKIQKAKCNHRTFANLNTVNIIFGSHVASPDDRSQ